MNETEILKKKIEKLEQTVNFFVRPDKYLFQRDIEFFNGKNIRVSKSTGTSFGTSTTDKISVYGKTPVVQAGAVSAPSGGVNIDTESRTAISSIINALHNFGIIA